MGIRTESFILMLRLVVSSKESLATVATVVVNVVVNGAFNKKNESFPRDFDPF